MVYNSYSNYFTFFNWITNCIITSCFHFITWNLIVFFVEKNKLGQENKSGYNMRAWFYNFYDNCLISMRDSSLRYKNKRNV